MVDVALFRVDCEPPSCRLFCGIRVCLTHPAKSASGVGLAKLGLRPQQLGVHGRIIASRGEGGMLAGDADMTIGGGGRFKRQTVGANPYPHRVEAKSELLCTTCLSKLLFLICWFTSTVVLDWIPR